jgi:hypothetical protein
VLIPVATSVVVGVCCSEEGQRCRKIVLTLRIRAEGAAREPGKLLGCGWCSVYNKTVSVSTPIATAAELFAKCLAIYKVGGE